MIQEVITFAHKHNINHRVIGNHKVVLTYRDGYAEEYFLCDKNNEYASDLALKMQDFLALDARRYHVVSALRLRASELGATVNYGQIDMASGISYGGLWIGFPLNIMLKTGNDKDALNKLLSFGLPSNDSTVERLLRLEPTLDQATKTVNDICAKSNEPHQLLEDLWQGVIDSFVEELSELDDDYRYNHEEADAEQVFTNYLDTFVNTLPLQSVPVSDFPHCNDYSQIDSWAMEKIQAFRQKPDLNFFTDHIKHNSLDWYISAEDWSRAVDNFSEKHGNLISYGYIKIALGTVSEAERQQIQEWINGWLETGCDFDCFMGTLVYFMDDVPELSEYFYEFENISEAICTWRQSIDYAEFAIREYVLADWRDEDEKTVADFFEIQILVYLTADEIRQIFTTDELAMFYRYTMAQLDTFSTEDDVKHNFYSYFSLAIKLEWDTVIQHFCDSKFLSQVLWQTTRTTEQAYEFYDQAHNAFIAHLSDVNHPQQQQFTQYAKKAFKLAKTYMWDFGFDHTDLLLWTLEPSQHDFIRPYFAYLIQQRIDNPYMDTRINDDTILAIGWSRLRTTAMQALDY